MNFFNQLISKNKLVFKSLLLLDVVILLLHLVLGRYQAIFHMDFEQNLPTYYQSAKLIGFGLMFIFFGLLAKFKEKVRSFIIPLALFIIVLGLDELLQIHENIYRIFEFIEIFHPSRIVELSMKMGYRSSLWILYYIPFIFVFVFWSGYWLHYFQSKMKKYAWVLALSSLCLFLVLLTEILSSTGTYAEGVYFWLITLEESAEMLLGSTLVLVGSKVLNRELKNSSVSRNQLP